MSCGCYGGTDPRAENSVIRIGRGYKMAPILTSHIGTVCLWSTTIGHYSISLAFTELVLVQSFE
jgi:hypothetical protein